MVPKGASSPKRTLEYLMVTTRVSNAVQLLEPYYDAWSPCAHAKSDNVLVRGISQLAPVYMEAIDNVLICEKCEGTCLSSRLLYFVTEDNKAAY